MEISEEVQEVLVEVLANYLEDLKTDPELSDHWDIGRVEMLLAVLR